MWRAIRYGLSGDLIDLERGDVLPARARIERLIEWVLPVAPRSAPPTGCGSRSRTRPSVRLRDSPRAATWPRSTVTSPCAPRGVG